MYSFFIISSVILEVIFKNTFQCFPTLSNCALKKTAILSLLTAISSDSTQFGMSKMMEMLWRILSPLTTAVSISTFSPYHVSSRKCTSKQKMIELTYNTMLFFIKSFPIVFKFYTLIKVLTILIIHDLS